MTDDVPLSLADSAVAMHELFLSLVQAGFTERQGLFLISQILREAAGGQT